MARREAIAVRLPRRLRVTLGAESELWAVLLVVVPVLAVGLTLLLGPTDPDYWWHLATGDWILAHRRIPFSDPFSWTHAGQRWVAHEWLAELILALANRAAGYAGALLLTAGTALTGYWWLLRAVRLYGLSRRAICLLVLLWGGIPLWALAVRPQVFGWALFCTLLAELIAYQTGRRRRLWVLPLVFILWINLNLTALIGAGCLAIFALGRLLRRRPDRHVMVVCLLCAGALLLNPRGPALLRFAFDYARPNALRYSFIGEWQRPAVRDLTLLPFWLATPLLLPALWVLVRRRAIWPALLPLLSFVESLRAQRYTPIFGLVLLPFAGWLVWRRSGPASAAGDQLVEAGSLAGPLWPRRRAVCAPLLGAIFVLGLLSRLDIAQFHRRPSERGYPAAAASVLRERYADARLFNTYTWGGYLIFREYPALRVYVDGREEMYGDGFLRQFLDLAAGGAQWPSVFAREAITAALVERSAGLAGALSDDQAWQIAYEDRSSVLFVRAR